MTRTYLFLISYTKVYLVNAVTEICYVSDSTNEDSSLFIYEDSTKIYDTSAKECCKRANAGWPWFILLSVLFILTILFFCGRKICSMFCDNHPENTSNEIVSRFAQFRTLERSSPGNVPSPPILEGGTSIEGSTHPITPPPTYDAALSAPTLPPEDTVPSYEDVMKGKNI